MPRFGPNGRKHAMSHPDGTRIVFYLDETDRQTRIAVDPAQQAKLDDALTPESAQAIEDMRAQVKADQAVARTQRNAKRRLRHQQRLDAQRLREERIADRRANLPIPDPPVIPAQPDPPAGPAAGGDE